MNFWLGFRAMLKKELLIMIRYIANTIGGMLTFYLVFLLIFMGYRGGAGAGASFGEGTGHLIVGYTTWLLMLITYQTIPETVQREAQEGTLEQLYMSPLGFKTLASFKLIAEVLIHLVLVIAILILLILTTGRSLHIDVISLAPLVLLALLAASGLGFFFGGVTLLFKRIQSYLQIIQFALVALIAAPPAMAFFRWLPLTLPAHWIREVMVHGDKLSVIPLADWWTMLLTAAIYLGVGLAMFSWCEKKARQQGIIGHF